jgi:hypothetical protein
MGCKTGENIMSKFSRWRIVLLTVLSLSLGWVAPTFAQDEEPPAPKVNIRVICGYGVGTACSERSVEDMSSRKLRMYNDKYPLQPIVEAYQDKYQVFTYDELYNSDTKQTVADSIIAEIRNNPGEINVLVTFSAGTVSGDKIYDTLPEEITAFVALGTLGLEDEADFKVDPAKLFLANEPDYAGILNPKYPHTNLAVNAWVASDVIAFIDQVLMKYRVGQVEE